MVKSPDAFRTISEVADWLGIQAHVLRFWESKFTQVKPIKRAGGRRYYRPADMLLLGGIKKLLHDDGLTIKGVQKILREEGMTHVSALSAPLDELGAPQADAAPMVAAPAERQSGVVLKFGAAAGEPPAEADSTRTATPDFERDAAQPPDLPEPSLTADAPQTPEKIEQPGSNSAADLAAPAEPSHTTEPDEGPAFSPIPPEDDHPRATPDPLAPADAEMEDAPRLSETSDASAPSDDAPDADLTASAEDNGASSLPDFLQHPLGGEASEAEDTPPKAATTDAEAADDSASTKAPIMDDDAPRPAVLDLPAFTPEADFPAHPGLLSRIARARRLPRDVQPEVASLLLELADMRARMDANSGAGSNF